MSVTFWELYWERPAAVVEYAARRIGSYEVDSIRVVLSIMLVNSSGWVREVIRSLLSDEDRLISIIGDLSSGLKPREELVDEVGKLIGTLS